MNPHPTRGKARNSACNGDGERREPHRRRMAHAHAREAAHTGASTRRTIYVSSSAPNWLGAEPPGQRRRQRASGPAPATRRRRRRDGPPPVDDPSGLRFPSMPKRGGWSTTTRVVKRDRPAEPRRLPGRRPVPGLRAAARQSVDDIFCDHDRRIDEQPDGDGEPSLGSSCSGSFSHGRNRSWRTRPRADAGSDDSVSMRSRSRARSAATTRTRRRGLRDHRRRRARTGRARTARASVAGRRGGSDLLDVVQGGTHPGGDGDRVVPTARPPGMRRDLSVEPAAHAALGIP